MLDELGDKIEALNENKNIMNIKKIKKDEKERVKMQKHLL